ncbi:uncharacterized protein LOC122018989 [Zingiber officinale]|uniref:uncharacterized protein LOC122018989 n=1 Tax=Zingiber officinale TaxID=94328 RepID=UPI001C4DB10F|nr:uncharacterized protein LOC122018989 [Zingiber officinale]
MERFVVDISSDEEEDYGRGRTDRRSFDWVDELLDRAVGRRVEESDDVVVVDEFSLPAAKKRRLNPEPLGLSKRDDEDDDECLVLEADPDKPAVAAEDKNLGGDEEDDDLLVVAEKGQVACRDYPHSRDQCATYPFASSSHREYCHLCHCYVCDSPAPCSYWGNGNFDRDHCHASDKEERWKSLRKYFKQKNTTTAHPLNSTNDSFNIPTYRNAVPLSHSNMVPLRSSSLQQCSTISNSDLTDIVNQCQPYIASSRNLQLGQQLTRSSLNPRLQHVQNEVHLPALNSQRMHSHARSRSLGSMQSGSAVIASHSLNNISHHNRAQRAVQQKSTYTTVSSQIPYCNQGQLRSEDVLVVSPVIPDQMQTTLYSESTVAQVESSTLPLITATDIMEKSWEDLLASLQSELEDPTLSDFGINNNHQSLLVPSPPLHCDNLLYGTDATIATSSAPVINRSPIRYEPSLSNDRMDQILGHDQGKDPDLKTAQTPNVSQVTSFDSLIASMENEIWS